MGAHKAPGPDEFPPYFFFQKFWHIISEKVTEAAQYMFLVGRTLPGTE